MTQERRAQFRASMHRDWAAPTRLNYRFIRHEPQATNALLRRPGPERDGGATGLTGSRTEILQLFWQGWRRYFRPYPTAEAPTFPELQQEFAEEIAALRARALPRPCRR